ncbi:MarR family transcriptional regulator [Gammaproteobacteria bacterium 42_54_T18]|nr:MarR family transcriptional regulator [Gammaproteobacteria bacterium 42_54_T18]
MTSDSTTFEPCYNLALRKSNRLITQFYEERLAPFSLKAGQFSILRAVHLCKTTTNKMLQQLLVIDQTTLSRNLKPLVRDELVIFTTDDNDQRIKNISLSSKGESLYQEALPHWEQAQKDLSKQLGKESTDAILLLSENVVAALSNS